MYTFVSIVQCSPELERRVQLLRATRPAGGPAAANSAGGAPDRAGSGRDPRGHTSHCDARPPVRTAGGRSGRRHRTRRVYRDHCTGVLQVARRAAVRFLFSFAAQWATRQVLVLYILLRDESDQHFFVV